MSIGFGAYGEKNFNRPSFGELVNLSPQMQSLLPGASLEAGYSITGPDDGGYFGVKGPDLPTPAYTSGVVDFNHPLTQKLLFKAKPTKPSIALTDDPIYSIMGWVLVALLLFMFLK